MIGKTYTKYLLYLGDCIKAKLVALTYIQPPFDDNYNYRMYVIYIYIHDLKQQYI